MHLADFRGKSIADVRAALLDGHPIIAWVGTAAGPTSTWLTPSGKKVTLETAPVCPARTNGVPKPRASQTNTLP